MENLQIGDVVTLKSGGQKMTISSDNNDGSYQCIWLLDGKPMAADYKKEVLMKYTPPTITVGSRPNRRNHY